MAYKFIDGRSYLMPTHFGPIFGATSLCSAVNEGRKFDYRNSDVTTISIKFLSNSRQLKELIPTGVGLEIGEAPIVTVTAGYFKNLPWLAGHGYNVLGVKIPVIFSGDKDHVNGDLLLVQWQNLTDPIIVGREELGYSKIYAEIPEPTIHQGETHCIASWLGFKFFDSRLKNMRRLSPQESTAVMNQQTSEGSIHFKYIPRTGEWGKVDVSYVTSSPKGTLPRASIKEVWLGEGTVEFHEAAWEDLPTQFRIVNAFHNLEINEYRGATIVKGTGLYGDLSGTRILQ